MQRLLRLGTVALVLFSAFQAGRLMPAAGAVSSRSISDEMSLDLSPSPYRETLDRRLAAQAANAGAKTR